MKVLMIIINWEKNVVPILNLYEGQQADRKALDCWNLIKDEWPGCGMHLVLDEEMKEARARKEPVSLILTDRICLTFLLPNNSQTRAAIAEDDRVRILAHADSKAPFRGSYLTLKYQLETTEEALAAIERSDWLWLIQRGNMKEPKLHPTERSG